MNCDDCWAVSPGSKDPEIGGPPRGADGQILPNTRFPDIKAMVDYIHAKGLKAGIYTSPGPRTCAGFEGSWPVLKRPTLAGSDAPRDSFAGGVNFGANSLTINGASPTSFSGTHTFSSGASVTVNATAAASLTGTFNGAGNARLTAMRS